MIKVLIAEDEAIERKALKFFFNEYYPEKIKITSMVDNGTDAVSNAINEKPDIIMMDIKMPEMNGIKASKVIKQKLPDTEIIILTAYSEFEFARQAVQLRAIDYLLKPCSTEKFCAIIDKAVIRIENKKEISQRQSYLKKKVNKMLPYMEKEIIMEMIYGKHSGKNFEEYKNILNIVGDQYLSVIINTQEDVFFNNKIMEECKTIFMTKINEVFAYVGLKDMIFLLVGDKLLTMKKEGVLEKLLKDIIKQIKSCYKINVCAAVGEIFTEGKDIYKSYNKARTALENDIKLIGHYCRKNQTKPAFPYKKESIICEKIVNEDLKGAELLLKDIFLYLSNSEKAGHGDIVEYLKELMIYINRYVINFFGNYFEQPFDNRVIEKKLRRMDDIYQLENYMQYLIVRTIEAISHHKMDRNAQIIEEVKKYLEVNYQKDISLNDVAEYISFSPYYFSRLFKKVEGINYRDYLIKVRMEKAKELLNEGKSIKEISCMVGYSDPNYFSRAFKKYNGVSPSLYNN